jgi:hypothetical protein
VRRPDAAIGLYDLAVRVLALVVVASACGNHAGPAAPQSLPSVRLVRCAAATPPPQLGADDELGAGVRLADEVTFELASNGKRAVFLGTPRTTGELDKILPVLRARQGELTRCHNLEGPATNESVVYRFTIAGDGTVSKVETTSSLGGGLDTCVKRVLRSLVFPSHKSGDVLVTLPLVFDSTGRFREQPSVLGLGPWTPFALDSAVPGLAATGAARAMEAAMRGRLDAIDTCFTGPAPTGSLRVMLEINVNGELGEVRTGGLGDAAGEACVTRALGGLRVVTPVDEYVEIACDLARGDAQPWRVAPAAGYGVIEADRAQLRHGKATLVPGATDPEPLPLGTYVVVARRDTPGAMLQLGLLWANNARAVLLALDAGTAPPVFLGVGQTSATLGEDTDESEAVRPALRVNGKTVTGCAGRATHQATLADPSAVGALVQRLATKCRTIACASTLLVAIDSDAVARDLVEVTGAARRAGFERVLLGGSELGCDATTGPTKPRPRLEEVDDE